MSNGPRTTQQAREEGGRHVGVVVADSQRVEHGPRPDGHRTTRPVRWKLIRGFHVQRWHIAVALRVYHGLGQPQFEFAFQFGRPKRTRYADYIDFEGDEVELEGFGI